MLHLKTNGGAIQILQLKTDGDGKGTSTIMPSFQLMKRRQMERAHCPAGENQSRPSLNRPKPISAHLLSNAPMSQPQKFLFPPEGGNKKQKKITRDFPSPRALHPQTPRPHRSALPFLRQSEQSHPHLTAHTPLTRILPNPTVPHSSPSST
jgi:hypothetical protein